MIWRTADSERLFTSISTPFHLIKRSSLRRCELLSFLSAPSFGDFIPDLATEFRLCGHIYWAPFYFGNP